MNSLHERRLFLILIPCINLINYYLTYTTIQAGWRLPVTFLIDTLQGYAAWWAVHSVIRHLDRRFTYKSNLWQRLVLQGVLTTAVGISVIIILTELVNKLATDSPVPANFYTHDIFLFFIWILLINGIYVGAHLYAELRRTEQTRQLANLVQSPGFLVRSGKQRLVVPYLEIAGFCVEDEYTLLITGQSKRYVLDQSLDKVEESLPGEWFFRLNRQLLLHRQMITGFRRLDNGKLSVSLKAGIGFPDQTPVSRTKAVVFKRWFIPDESTDNSPAFSLHFADKPTL